MKWEADSIRRSRLEHSSWAVLDVAAGGGDASQRVEGEHLDRRVIVVREPGPSSAASRSPAPGSPSAASMAASRHSPSAASSPPPASRCQAAAASSAARARSTCPSRPQHTTQVHPASAARRTSPVASAFSIASSRVADAGVVVPGLALGSAQARRPGRPRSAGTRADATSRPRGRGGRTASSNRCWSRASSPSIASPRTCSQGSSTCSSQRCTCVGGGDGCAARHRPRSPPERRTAPFAAWSHGRSIVS